MKNLIAVLVFAGVLLLGAVGQAASQTPTPAPQEESATPAAQEAAATPAAQEEITSTTPAAQEEITSTAPAAQEEVTSTAPTGTLAQTVRDATAQFKDVAAAEKAGYALLHGCVSSPTGGAMGVHYVNGDLVGDGKIDAQHPEAMIYEQSYGRLHLVGVEYLVLAEAWDAANKTPPVLMGQLFNYYGAPNRYGIPAFYELHVWAWKVNPTGTFADWNPLVSCDEYTGETMTDNSGQ